MPFKITLQAARVNAGLTLEQAAQALGINVKTLHNWEHGKTEPRASQLATISEKYGIPADYIFLPSVSR